MDKSMIFAGSNIPEEVQEHLIAKFLDTIKAYQRKDADAFGSASGKFIEDARRVVEWKCDGKYTPYDKPLSKYNMKELTRIENTNASDEWRTLVPRALFSMSCIRNHRGMVHESKLDPTMTDMGRLMAECKWLMSEIVRLEANLDLDEVKKILDIIQTRDVEIIWEGEDVVRVLIPKLSCANQVLVLLYAKDRLTVDALLKFTEYKNHKRFREEILRNLHSKRLIEFDGENCEILPPGIRVAQEIIKKEN